MPERVTMTAAQLAGLVKAGPHGFSHGWVKAGEGPVFTSAHRLACPDGHKGDAIVPDGSGVSPHCTTCGKAMTPKGKPLSGSWQMDSCCTPSGPGGKWAGPPRNAAKCTRCHGTRQHATCTRCGAGDCDGKHDDCAECDGTGKATCGTCDGDGVLDDDGTPCPDCDDGNVTCPQCHGTGAPAKAAKAAVASLAKVGPKGYIHGWIKVGAGDEGNGKLRDHLAAAEGAHAAGDHPGGDRHLAAARRAARDPATRQSIGEARGHLAADRLNLAMSAKDRKAAAAGLSDAELTAADKELARRAAALGKAGQVSKSHKAVKDEAARRKAARG